MTWMGQWFLGLISLIIGLSAIAREQQHRDQIDESSLSMSIDQERERTKELVRLSLWEKGLSKWSDYEVKKLQAITPDQKAELKVYEQLIKAQHHKL